MKAGPEKKAKVRHIYSLMCEALVVGNDGRFSLINVIANIKLKSLPGGMATLGIAIGFIAPPGETFSVVVEDPKRVPVFETPEQAVKPHDLYREVPLAVKATQAAIILEPIVFRLEGIHHIVLRVGGRVVHREPFGVFIDPKRAPEEGEHAFSNDVPESLAKDLPSKRRRNGPPRSA